MLILQESAFEQQLYRLNPWWDQTDHGEQYLPRPRETGILLGQLSDRCISLLTGLRRIGKTTLMRMLAHECIRNGTYAPREILYVTLDDYIVGGKPVLELLDLFRRLHRHRHDRKLLLLIDEVTYRPDFEQQLKNLYDSHNVKVYASSSCASMLRRRKALLTGRARTTEILPLDFPEFMAFRRMELSPADNHLLPSYFDEYLRTGGIPEYVLRRDPGYLRELIDDIIIKDIGAMHGVRDVQVLRDFFLLLMERAGKTASINKMAHILGIAPDTSRRYFDLFCETYLIHPVHRHGTTNERMLSPRKVYAADLGVRTLYTGVRDKGSLFENYVYLKLKHRNPFYVVRDRIEIDFMTEDGLLVEVKYGSTMNPKQQALFDEMPATRKLLVQGLGEIGAIDEE